MGMISRMRLSSVSIVLIAFATAGDAFAADENRGNDPDIPDDHLGAAASAKIGSNDAWLNRTGRITRTETFGGGGSGSVEASALGAGLGSVKSLTLSTSHTPFLTETYGNSCQLRKPMLFDSSTLDDGTTVSTNLDIHFDGLLVVREELAGAEFTSQSRVEYMAEVGQYNSASGEVETLGNNVFDGVAWVTDDGAGVTISVPETYKWMEDEPESANSWYAAYNQGKLKILKVVSGAAGAGEILNTDPSLPAALQAEYTAHMVADPNRNVYYVVYDDTFTFDADVGETYFMNMDLQTATGSFGDSWANSYALSDFSNTINYQFSGTGLTLQTLLLVNGAETVNSDDFFGGSSSTTNLSCADLTFANAYNLASQMFFTPATTNAFNTGAFDPVLSGVISGSGTLLKTGTGTLTLSGDSSGFTGTANVSQGTLAVDTGSDATTFNGTLAGGGTFQKTGAGELTLPSANNSSGFTGATQINAGTLTLDGQLGGDLTVASGATFKGTGTLGGTLGNSGTVAPGNSIGTTVVGSYTQGSGSVLEVEIDNSGNADLLTVTGAATIDGGTIRAVPLGFISTSQSYLFMTAGGGITVNTDPTLDTALIDFTVGLQNAGTEYWMDVVRAPFASLAVTANQTAVAENLQVLAASASGDLLTVLNQIDTLDSAGVQSAYDQIGGELYGTLAVVGRENTSFVYGILAEQLRSRPTAYTGPVTSSQPLPEDTVVRGNNCAIPWTGWMIGYGRGGSARTDGNAHGFDYSLGGTLLAIERPLTCSADIGLHYSYGRSYLNTADGLVNGTDLDSHHWGAYLTNVCCDHYLTLAGGFGYDNFRSARNLQIGAISRTARADHHGWQSSVFAEYGRTFTNGCWMLQPFAGLHYINVRQEGLAETGADALSLALGGIDSNALRTNLGGRLAANLHAFGFGCPDFELSAYWAHELLDELTGAGDVRLGAGGPAYPIRGLNVGRDWVVIQPGLKWTLGDHTQLRADYNLTCNAAMTSHAGAGGVEIAW